MLTRAFLRSFLTTFISQSCYELVLINTIIMVRPWKYIAIVVWAYIVFVVSISLFSRGFLLRRDVVLEKSRCFPHKSYFFEDLKHKDTLSKYIERDVTVSEGTNSLPLIDILLLNSSLCIPSSTKVVLIIVDALRYDFMKFDENLNHTQSFQNKIPIVHELVKLKPQNARLFKFIADPPTTTMQRLKGMTTGSLPTFIDVGSNFATSEINEDNFIDQVLAQNEKIVFMGDDTWTGLYPERFVREYAYPSFNVWDLDSVDNGVLYHLTPEIQKNDWKLLIAHFLGVDHCGHKYGPRHPEMKRKLQEVNAMIRRSVDSIDNDTVVFVLGDHGMTSTGDHGGESEEEVAAALFVYSSFPLFSREEVEYTESVSQVDLVPTISFLLGIPIPFSNLGKVILGSLPYIYNGTSLPDRQYAKLALWRNVQQVKDYFDYYSEYLGRFPPEKLGKLHNLYAELRGMLHTITNLEEFRKFSNASSEYLTLARQMCAQIWVQFDFTLMTAGLSFMFIFIILFLFILEGLNHDRMHQLTNSSKIFALIAVKVVVSFSICALLFKSQYLENVDVLFYLCNCSLAVIFMLVIVFKNWSYLINQVFIKLKSHDMVSVCTRVIFLSFLFGPFSNSYVIEESTVISYFLISLSFVVLYGSARKEQGKSKHDRSRGGWKGGQLRFKTVATVILFAAIIRISHHYWRCREEQKWCNMSEWIKVSSSAAFSSISIRYLYSLVCLALLVTVFRMWLRSCGNLVGFSLIVTVVRYMPTVIAICISAFWVLQGFPKSGKYGMKPWQIEVWPSIVFVFLGLSIATLFACPLCIFKLPKTKVTMEGVYGQDNIIPHLFNQIKGSLDKRNKCGKLNNLKDFPVVYGLASVYSASIIILSLFVLLLISLLLGDVLAPSAFLMFLATVLCLAVHTLSRHEKIIISSKNNHLS
ncbi:hypothetical protein J437_LFUL010474, partial [Ladona fulva]